MDRPPRDTETDRLISGPLLRYSYLIVGVMEAGISTVAFFTIFWSVHNSSLIVVRQMVGQMVGTGQTVGPISFFTIFWSVNCCWMMLGLMVGPVMGSLVGTGQSVGPIACTTFWSVRWSCPMVVGPMRGLKVGQGPIPFQNSKEYHP